NSQWARISLLLFVSIRFPIRVSAVAIELDPLNIEFARRQPQMPPLMGLISVQPTSGLPQTFHIFPFLSRKDADERRVWRVGLESYDQTRTGKDKLVRAYGDRQPSGNRVGSLSARCRRRGWAFVGYVQ